MLQSYRALEAKLLEVRRVHSGRESVEEDELLDEMERVWWLLSDAERALLDSEGSTCWP